jgi:hypothetical protein
MSFLTKIPKFTFYYILPTFAGFSLGLLVRDYFMLNADKKLAMSLADYYEYIDEEPELEINKYFPEVQRLLKRINKQKQT